MNRIALFLLLGSTIGWTQNYSEKGLNIKTEKERTIITFIDGNAEVFYLNGQQLSPYGRLKLNSEQYMLLIEDLKKALKKNAATIKRNEYELNKFNFSEDEVFLTVYDNVVDKQKVGTITREQIKIIEKL